jgi:hypothetical protein
MFEFSKDAQIFDSLKSVAEKLSSMRMSLMGNFYFSTKKANFLELVLALKT